MVCNPVCSNRGNGGIGKMASSAADLIRYYARHDHYKWTRAAFYWANQTHLIDSPALKLTCDFIDRIMRGEIIYGLINEPPRSGKTEVCVVSLAARIFAINPAAKILYATYNDELSVVNSQKILNLVTTPQFKAIFPEFRLKRSRPAGFFWETTSGGAFRAATSNAGITGFEAGIKTSGSYDPFSGILIGDDPEKATTSTSEPETKKYVGNMMSAIVSRRNHRHVPVVMVQQRLTQSDFSASVLNGALGYDIDVLAIPAISENGKPPRHYYDYKYARVFDYTIDAGPTVPETYTEDHVEMIRQGKMNNGESNLSGPGYVASQLQQNPTDPKMSLFDAAWIKNYGNIDITHLMDNMTMRIDTAQKGTDKSDYNGVVIFGHERRNNEKLYVLDADRRRCEMPELIEWITEKSWHMIKCQSGARMFTDIIIEDANIGHALMINLQRHFKQIGLPVRVSTTDKKRDDIFKSKFTRADNSVSFFLKGMVLFPSEVTEFMQHRNLEGVKQLLKEYSEFNTSDTHASDDLLDPLIWEVCTKFIKPKRFIYEGQKWLKAM